MNTALFRTSTLTRPAAGGSIRNLAASLTVLAALTGGAMALAAPTPAAAQSAEALNHWDAIGAAEQDLIDALQQVEAFTPKPSYCSAAEKAADQARLDGLKAKAEAAIAQMRRSRALLTKVVANDGIALSLFQKKAQSSGLPDFLSDNGWSQYLSGYVSSLGRAYQAKTAAIAAAPVDVCAVDPDQPDPVTDPGATLDLGLPAKPQSDLSKPERFCHLDEKTQAVDRFAEALYRLDQYLIDLDRVHLSRLGRDRARLVKAEADARKAAAESGRKGLKKQQASRLENARLARMAIERVDAAIAAAKARMKEVDQDRVALDAVFQQVRGAPIVDCLGSTPRSQLRQVLKTNFPGAGGVADPSLRAVDIPAPIPPVVETDAEKGKYIVDASRAWSDATHNRSAWEDRLMAIEWAMRGKPDDAQLQAAREEARAEHNKARKVVDEAQIALNLAFAIVVKPKVALVDPARTGTGVVEGGMLGALEGASGGNPAGQDRMAQDGWGVAGEGGNADGDGVLTGPQGGAFDGSEAEAGLKDRMHDADQTRHAEGPRQEPAPVEPPHAEPVRDTPPMVEPKRPVIDPDGGVDPEGAVRVGEPTAPAPVEPSKPGHTTVDPTPPPTTVVPARTLTVDPETRRTVTLTIPAQPTLVQPIERPNAVVLSLPTGPAAISRTTVGSDLRRNDAIAVNGGAAAATLQARTGMTAIQPRAGLPQASARPGTLAAPASRPSTAAALSAAMAQ